MGSNNVISLEEGRQKLVQKRTRSQESLLNQQLKRGDPVMLADCEADASIFPQHQHIALAHHFNMPLPPRGFLITEDDEIEFSPPSC